MGKKIILPSSILLVGIVAIALLVLAKPAPKPHTDTLALSHIKVTVVKAAPQTLELSIESQGTVTPKREIDIVAEVSGQIMSVDPDFVNGGFFNRHQKLLTVDARTYDAAVLSAKARLAEAERKLAEEKGLSRQAKREWRDLGDTNANDLFIRKPQLAAAEANRAFAQADLAIAELNVERTQIIAPFNGRIKQTHANLGQYVSQGTRLATLYDSGAVEIRLPLTEHQAGLIHLPLIAEQKHTSPAVTITATVAGQKQQWQGLITRTDAFVDSNSRYYYAIVEINNPFNIDQLPLLPGLFVEAKITGKTFDHVLILPRQALFENNKLLTLDTDNKIILQTVTVLKKTATHIWVQSTIAADTLITLDKQSLTPANTQVEPIPFTASEPTISTAPDAKNNPASTTINEAP
ncbi:MAG: efflux RND transporter periplasmic adaptor subunit [Marinagarivorans sp.]|nr:efflux RND transporter periplasmic adaptor subunit [Marinagarivorans sp.]